MQNLVVGWMRKNEPAVMTALTKAAQEQVDVSPTNVVIPSPSNTHTPSPTYTPEAPDLPALEDNAACFGTQNEGIVCLDDTGWIEIPYLTGYDFTDFTSCQERVLWLIEPKLLYYNGLQWEQVSRCEDCEYSLIACNGNNQTWVANADSARFFDGAVWSEYLYSDLFGDKDWYSVEGIAVGQDQEVWILVNNSILHYNGVKWDLFEKDHGFTEDYNFKSIVLDSKGFPWAAHSSGIVIYDGEAWKTIEAPSSMLINSMVIDDAERVWVGTETGVSVYEKRQWRHYPVDKLGGSVHGLALDDQQRLWAGSEWGVGVLENEQWTFFHMHDSELPMNYFSRVMVLGNGPQLPALIEKETGGMNGTLLNSGNPLVNSTVEICVQPLALFFSGPTPCSGQPFIAKTVTDASGKFTFTDLPAGDYSVTFQTPDKSWKILSASFTVGSKQVRVFPGEIKTLDPMDIAD